MKRLVIICEGETEQAFCKGVLSDYLFAKGICINTPLIKKSMGGIVPWKYIRRQVVNHLNEKDVVGVTTFIDLYGITEKHVFPGWQEAVGKSDKYELIHTLEDSMYNDISNELFVPYIQLHEFETLLFCEKQVLVDVLPEGELEDEKELDNILSQFPNPELINNKKETSPSHRIQKIIPSYEKVVYGSCIAEEIGLARIRNKCRHFDEWVSRLEVL